MATKSKKSASESDATFTRITANTTKKAAAPAKKAAPKQKTAKQAETTPAPAAPAPRKRPATATPFVATGRYFKGAWDELKQVRWPTRRATWSLTGAMLVFTASFATFILLLDALFKYLLELMLG